MSRVVLKYRPTADMPVQHKFLHAAVVSDELFVWLEINIDPQQLAVSPYVVIPTGYSEVPEGATHKATAINYRTGIVWHVYDTRGSH